MKIDLHTNKPSITAPSSYFLFYNWCHLILHTVWPQFWELFHAGQSNIGTKIHLHRTASGSGAYTISQQLVIHILHKVHILYKGSQLAIILHHWNQWVVSYWFQQEQELSQFLIKHLLHHTFHSFLFRITVEVCTANVVSSATLDHRLLLDMVEFFSQFQWPNS